MQGHFEQAISAYAEAVSISPTNLDAYIGAVYAYKLSECELACSAARTYLRLLEEQGTQERYVCMRA
jgi:hypothetical protein